MKRRSVVLLFSALGLIHCSGGSDDDVVMIRDSGVVEEDPPDAGFRDGGRPPRDGGMRVRDAGVADDDDDFDSANGVVLGTVGGHSGVINPAGDRDFYRVQLNAGIWLWLATTTEETNGVTTNPVLRLYGPDRTLVAENDTRELSSDTDAEIYYHVPETGLYYVEVLEWSDWSPDSMMPVGGRDYLYKLFIQRLQDDRSGVAFDLERGDDSASAIRLEFDGNQDGIVGGTFDDRLDDRDVFTVTFSSSGLLRFSRMPVGPMGYGSTTTGGDLIVTNVDTGSVAASLPMDEGLVNLRVPYYPGTYEVTVTHPGDVVGANDFYIFKTFLLTENTPVPPEPNDDPMTAPLLTLNDNTPRAAFILTDLYDGDVDVFAFEVRAGEKPSVACGARTAGSGVLGLTAELLDPQLQVLGEDTEEGTGNAFIPQTTTSTGVHYVRLTKAGQVPGVDGQWVRCGIRSGP